MVGKLFNKKTVKDIDLKNKRVLLRADYNVPVKNGKVGDDYRIKQSISTIDYILAQPGSSLVIISHLGRPDGKPDEALSLKPIAQHLSELLKKPVNFASDCIGEPAQKAAQELKAGQVVLLENLRFHAEEEKNDKAFAKALVNDSQAKVFVQDGFGVVHRAHASTEAITKLLPSVAGLLLTAEVLAITKVMHEPERPLMAVVGGAKISDKIDVLNRFLDIADCVAVAGALANNFLAAEGHGVGDSLIEAESLDIARQVLAKARKVERERPFSFLVPVDVVVSESVGGRKLTRLVDIASQSLADINAYPKIPDPSSYSVRSAEMILDIGPTSAGMIAGAVKMARTVVWAGTCGVTETKGINGAHDPFAHGTHTVIEAMISESNVHKNKPFTLVGGGDTVAYVEGEDMTRDFSHVSTGGGASLELMAGKKLPGIEALSPK